MVVPTATLERSYAALSLLIFEQGTAKLRALIAGTIMQAMMGGQN